MVLYSWFFIVLLISFFYDLFDGYASRSNTSI
jgi:phosphatidylglycerophosphate synthase